MTSNKRLLTFIVLMTLSALAAGATPISDKYAALGGANGFLGAPASPETTAPDGVGKYRHYQNGSIYWHPQTGAHEVHGLIRQRWAQLGWELSYLGYPMSDEIDLVDGSGKVSKFQGGQVMWRTGASTVTEVKSTDLVVDLPFPIGEAWQIIQANAAVDADSHHAQFAYCWDMTLAGKPQSQTNGRGFVSAATGKIVYVDESFDGSANAGNVIVQRFGEGRYGSYLHIKKGSYTKKMVTGPGITFLPQATPWSMRPNPATGTVLGETGDTGANPGAFHMHFCVTTTPDRGAFTPFESVPVAFRNYSVSTNAGSSWTYVPVGVPRNGQWIRREQPKPGQQASAKVNTSATVISHGTVNGSIALTPGHGKPAGQGTLTITLLSAWGEPLRTKTVTVLANAPNGPWAFTMNDVPAYNGSKLVAGYTGPWSQPFDTLGGEGTPFDVAPNGTATSTVKLKSTLIK